MACQKEETIEVLANRTVLFYFGGDNNLSHFMQHNVEMIKDGMQKDNIRNGNILIYEDFKNQNPHLYQLKCGKDTIQQIEIETFDKDQNSASAETLTLILDKVLNRFPAESYGLVLSSHGTGWLPSNINHYLRSFGHDSSGGQMEINDLSGALSNYHFDFIIFDACYMAATEVAYSLRNCTDYIIASPNEILSEGFPFDSIMDDLFKEEADVKGIASTFFDHYKNSSGSISVIQTSQLEALANACQAIFKEKTKADLFTVSTKNLQIMENLKNNQHALYDFDDYVNCLATPEQYKTFKDCLNQTVIYKACTPTIYFERRGYIAINKFCGLSIYVPQKELNELNEWYKCLEWYQKIFPIQSPF